MERRSNVLAIGVWLILMILASTSFAGEPGEDTGRTDDNKANQSAEPDGTLDEQCESADLVRERVERGDLETERELFAAVCPEDARIWTTEEQMFRHPFLWCSPCSEDRPEGRFRYASAVIGDFSGKGGQEAFVRVNGCGHSELLILLRRTECSWEAIDTLPTGPCSFHQTEIQDVLLCQQQLHMASAHGPYLRRIGVIFVQQDKLVRTTFFSARAGSALEVYSAREEGDEFFEVVVDDLDGDGALDLYFALATDLISLEFEEGIDDRAPATGCRFPDVTTSGVVYVWSLSDSGWARNPDLEEKQCDQASD